ncbi:hypothetical protein GCM10007853_06270 [Algimonas ampicilliniresistens]|uniref:Uncharacterized protein n=1 Tax=Algimonas ampicilliniresistens TaxID=1298735 RepID=A0ABQ5V5L1_9PROT|nr:hypothetical protein GCM10007853_06270 [Algimonas ampicilliniresistens]
MTAKGNKPPLALDMPFGEALARFAQTDPDEMEGAIRIKKGGRKPPPKSSKKPS